MCARTSCSLTSVLDVVPPAGCSVCREAEGVHVLRGNGGELYVRADALGLTALFCRASPPFQGIRAKFAFSRAFRVGTAMTLKPPGGDKVSMVSCRGTLQRERRKPWRLRRSLDHPRLPAGGVTTIGTNKEQNEMFSGRSVCGPACVRRRARQFVCVRGRGGKSVKGDTPAHRPRGQ
jgi:hypothetical protein